MKKVEGRSSDGRRTKEFLKKSEAVLQDSSFHGEEDFPSFNLFHDSELRLQGVIKLGRNDMMAVASI